MNKFDLCTTVERATELLSISGLHKQNQLAYRHTGFDSIIHHFEQMNTSSVTTEMIDAFILEQWHLFNNGDCPRWKWKIIRRSCELLKLCASEDSVDLPILPPWDPIMKRSYQSIENGTPTKNQLADPTNIFSLIHKTNRAMHDLGLSNSTIRHYRNEGLSIILRRHYESGTEQLSEIILEQLVTEKRLQYERGIIARSAYQNLRKAAYWLMEIYKKDKISLSVVPDWGQREPNSFFASILNEFCFDAINNKYMAQTTINRARSAIRNFLFEMEDHGFNSLIDFTQANVNVCITSFSKNYSGGLSVAIYSIRKFFQFLFEQKLTPIDLRKSLPRFIACPKTFHEGFSEEELNLLLVLPNRNTSIGKRDYAMMVLATQSGLRACDVARLKLNNIDWRKREIQLVQHKTGQPLSLPLEPESGNAIAEYILSGRPSTKLPNLFLCNTGPIRPLDAKSISAIISRYMRSAGIPAERRAFHALRRTFGTRLLQSEISFELIQQLLGHTDINSMKPYLSVDELGLKTCALPLLSSEKAVD